MAANTNEPFSKVFEAWARAWAHNHFSAKEILILIALAQWAKTDENGRKYAWRSRSELAAFANCSEGGVTSAITRLKKTDPAKGRNVRGLELKSAGHKGRASEYYLMPDTPLPQQGKPRSKKQRASKQGGGEGRPHREPTTANNLTTDELIRRIQNGEA